MKATSCKIHTILIHAVTQYDQKQSKKKCYNCYALPQYIARVQEVVEDIDRGADIRQAITRGFLGSLGNVCLKALDLPKFEGETTKNWYYTPVAPEKKELVCDGRCQSDGDCMGEVQPVLVWGRGFVETMKFNYCEYAIASDKTAGYFVELQ